MATIAIHEKSYDDAIMFIESAYEHNRKMEKKGFTPYSYGRYFEVIGEIEFSKLDYFSSISAFKQSEKAYREGGNVMAADNIHAKIGLTKLLNGEIKEAGDIASTIWRNFNEDASRTRLMAYNGITLYKLSACAGYESDASSREKAILDWANLTNSGHDIIELLRWIKEIPCPERR
ncbi:MAG: hypothetical protein QNK37_08515 [Acidobacteriota bacterium]|nr:hypothetical protein [Acidobacteriota bacterium]